jgi:hypothetical protein
MRKVSPYSPPTNAPSPSPRTMPGQPHPRSTPQHVLTIQFSPGPVAQPSGGRSVLHPSLIHAPFSRTSNSKNSSISRRRRSISNPASQGNHQAHVTQANPQQPTPAPPAHRTRASSESPVPPAFQLAMSEFVAQTSFHAPGEEKEGGVGVQGVQGKGSSASQVRVPILIRPSHPGKGIRPLGHHPSAGGGGGTHP